MRSLIFADPHHRVRQVARLLERETYDQAVCLGDWQDDYEDGPAAARNTAAFLKDYLSDSRHKSLIGNHDVPYLWPNARALHCCGYTHEKQEAIANVLDPLTAWRAKMAFFCWVDGWLLTHAGLNMNLVPQEFRNESSALVWWFEHEVRTATAWLDRGSVHPLLAPGRDRGFAARVGGITWNDWDSLIPVPGLHQIVGHTCYPGLVRSKNTADSQNSCIDSGLRHYAIIAEGTLRIIEFT